jgi:hypothetical protein
LLLDKRAVVLIEAKRGVLTHDDMLPILGSRRWWWRT